MRDVVLYRLSAPVNVFTALLKVEFRAVLFPVKPEPVPDTFVTVPLETVKMPVTAPVAPPVGLKEKL